MFYIQSVQWAKQVASVGLCYMQVHQSGFNAFMTQKFLDGNDIHPELQQMRGITMTERMQGDPFLQPALLYRFAQRPLHATYTKRGAWAVAVEQIIYRLAGIVILSQAFKYQRREWNIPILVVLALTDVDHHAP